MPSAASGRGGGTSTLFAWGCGEDGQLGAAEAPTPGATETNDWCVEAPRAVELGESASGVIVSACAGSRNSVCVTTRDDSSSCEAYAWGWNSHRALGFSYEECDELHVKTPKRHSSMKTEDGERINVVAIASGGWHAVCVDSDGVAYGYGGNEYAQAGPPDANAEHRNTSIPDRDWAPIRALLWPPRKVSLPAPVAQVSCGGMSSFALLVRKSERAISSIPRTRSRSPHSRSRPTRPLSAPRRTNRSSPSPPSIHIPDAWQTCKRPGCGLKFRERDNAGDACVFTPARRFSTRPRKGGRAAPLTSWCTILTIF
ncbi:Regulator of chromosome condensation, RCC1 [Ostreococcus tauri]|uniref:Regulator of chromosome condensation, RCC1 n=1 Tax=Ostreococcus tauri TaxID=70448 RepID=A0A096P822_OSTTA|nr:Regulator of chromosome condensation, RCC1 [Ostreococcus tauri]CEG00400.1 Regulator of chromosome condensation, RCC1 [Ostreococcus tauri]|eukprot:XP_022840358.1 Regulator of chromosome condensation, RCC1 [Ostreococcus tauri]